MDGQHLNAVEKDAVGTMAVIYTSMHQKLIHLLDCYLILKEVRIHLEIFRNENKKRPICSHLNINSVRYKFDDLKQILDDNLTDLLIVSETKIDESFKFNLFAVDGYKMERRDRNARGGGFMTFVRSDLPFKRR